eukprot:CAMPEP_0185571366 /NCGR_PEP_ID=MMETSP0434-20130131/3430_1 /TAXON_ID=626734 ORGANISM="Favella taraikaensis, Strain Fe Narragansett Bay" /NCGR_SAMPLE_ID=MMETSP0434 /ASSEMBLY_ACC=CAM_ASM_000379 /LENGTH=84 /DNA_ID=CAMNT_0028186773 /DNA_START=420 /DNA_END=673 /DNA_ORIENTATION=+
MRAPPISTTGSGGEQGQDLTKWVVTESKKCEHARECSLDLVSTAVNLAYIPPERVKELELTTEAFMTNTHEKCTKGDIEQQLLM